MRQSRAIDVSTGLFVLLGLVAIVFLVTQISNREFTAGKEIGGFARQRDDVGLRQRADQALVLQRLEGDVQARKAQCRAKGARK